MLSLEKRSSLVSLASNSVTSPLKSLPGRLGKLWDLGFQCKFTLSTVACHGALSCKHVLCVETVNQETAIKNTLPTSISSNVTY
jgi:hypothetical protein